MSYKLLSPKQILAKTSYNRSSRSYSKLSIHLKSFFFLKYFFPPKKFRFFFSKLQVYFLFGLFNGYYCCYCCYCWWWSFCVAFFFLCTSDDKPVHKNPQNNESKLKRQTQKKCHLGWFYFYFYFHYCEWFWSCPVY